MFEIYYHKYWFNFIKLLSYLYSLCEYYKINSKQQIFITSKIMKPLNKEALDKIEQKDDDLQIKLLIQKVINRIIFFNKFWWKLDSKYLVEIYDWFVYRNLLNLYAFTEIYDLQKMMAFNIHNPFYIWAYYLDVDKHFDKAKETVRNMIEFAFMKKNPNEFKYGKRKEFQNINNMLILQTLKERFYNNIICSCQCRFNTNEINLIKKKLKFWNRIKDFLQFILSELPEKDIRTNTETDFYKNRFQLWKFYLEKTNKK